MKTFFKSEEIRLTKGKDGKYHVVWHDGGVPFRASFSPLGEVLNRDVDIIPEEVMKLVRDTLFPRRVLTRTSDGSEIIVSYNVSDETNFRTEFFWKDDTKNMSLGHLEFPDAEKRKKFIELLSNENRSEPWTRRYSHEIMSILNNGI